MNGKLADMIFTDPPYNVKVSEISLAPTGNGQHSEQPDNVPMEPPADVGNDMFDGNEEIPFQEDV